MRGAKEEAAVDDASEQPFGPAILQHTCGRAAGTILSPLGARSIAPEYVEIAVIAVHLKKVIRTIPVVKYFCDEAFAVIQLKPQ